MLRKDQLGNVAFGGAWSERIAADEALKEAADFIDSRIPDTLEEDLRSDNMLQASLELCASNHPKGAELSRAFRRGLAIEVAGLRRRELQRIATLLRAGLGERVAVQRLD